MFFNFHVLHLQHRLGMMSCVSLKRIARQLVGKVSLLSFDGRSYIGSMLPFIKELELQMPLSLPSPN